MSRCRCNIFLYLTVVNNENYGCSFKYINRLFTLVIIKSKNLNMRKLIHLISTALASHYRGGTYQFYPSVDGKTTISTTQTWRDTAAGYNPECTKDHVANQTPSLTTITVRDPRTFRLYWFSEQEQPVDP